MPVWAREDECGQAGRGDGRPSGRAGAFACDGEDGRRQSSTDASVDRLPRFGFRVSRRAARGRRASVWLWRSTACPLDTLWRAHDVLTADGARASTRAPSWTTQGGRGLLAWTAKAAPASLRAAPRPCGAMAGMTTQRALGGRGIGHQALAGLARRALRHPASARALLSHPAGGSPVGAAPAPAAKARARGRDGQRPADLCRSSPPTPLFPFSLSTHPARAQLALCAPPRVVLAPAWALPYEH